jgi:hypothetical protein
MTYNNLRIRQFFIKDSPDASYAISAARTADPDGGISISRIPPPTS